MPRLLIIEDEPAMRTALVETLRGLGYRVTSAATGPEGLEKACTEEADLILLDVMLPGLDGYALCRELRQRGRRTPVLMLTAKGFVDDRVEGLESGADDYLVKPFSMKELTARVRALLRRASQAATGPETLTLGEVVFDFKTMTCRRGSEALAVNAREMRIMRLLAERRGEPVSRETFLDVIWDYNAWPTTRSVDNYIAALRAKIEPDPDEPRWILTVRGTGYRLVPKDDERRNPGILVPRSGLEPETN
ncbi:MAG: response regulator transcription factor [Verrucomicrobiota bacterium]